MHDLFFKNLPEVLDEDFEVKLHAATIDIDNLLTTRMRAWVRIPLLTLEKK